MAALAVGLWGVYGIPTWLAVGFGAGGTASLLVNGVITQLGGGAIGLSGVGWVSLGAHLWLTADRDPTLARRHHVVPARWRIDPQFVVAGVIGTGLTAVGLAGIVPFGPITDLFVVSRGTGLALDGQAIDLAHVLTGIAGVAVALLGRRAWATGYNRAVGAAYLVSSALLVTETLSAAIVLPVNWRLVFLHLPVAVILAGTGFTVGSLVARSVRPAHPSTED